MDGCRICGEAFFAVLTCLFASCKKCVYTFKNEMTLTFHSDNTSKRKTITIFICRQRYLCGHKSTQFFLHSFEHSIQCGDTDQIKHFQFENFRLIRSLCTPTVWVWVGRVRYRSQFLITYYCSLVELELEPKEWRVNARWITSHTICHLTDCCGQIFVGLILSPKLSSNHHYQLRHRHRQQQWQRQNNIIALIITIIIASESIGSRVELIIYNNNNIFY